jgi:fatty acid desaturase
MNQARPVRTELDPEFLQPSDLYGWLAVARNTLPFFALLALAPMLAARSLPAAWLLAPLIGLFVYRMTIVMHDCAHGTLFRSSRLNRWMGQGLGAVTGIRFHSFWIQHWKHHRIFGQPGDPQGFHYLRVPGMSKDSRDGFTMRLRHCCTDGIG